MRLTKLKRLALTNTLVLGCFAAGSAAANGGHFLVDDATITDPGTCQLETWTSRFSGESFWVLQPACSTVNGWEFALPAVYSWSDNEFVELGLEAKTILSEDFAGGALAISIGTFFDLVDDEFAGGFVNFPYSRALDSYWTLHLNAGAEYDRFSSNWDATWGIATTYTLSQHIELIAETTGIGSDDPIFGIGARYAFERFDLDLGIAHVTELNDTIYTIGFNIAF